ncbi:MAG: hypothetical protein GXY36_10565 [Chloroflexi bacterium]|nr:hypothetical protein [Chloroflexota bacterium]
MGLAELLPIAAGIAGAFWGVTHLSLPRLATFANDLDHRTWPVLRSPAAGRAASWAIVLAYLLAGGIIGFILGALPVYLLVHLL